MATKSARREWRHQKLDHFWLATCQGNRAGANRGVRRPWQSEARRSCLEAGWTAGSGGGGNDSLNDDRLSQALGICTADSIKIASSAILDTDVEGIGLP